MIDLKDLKKRLSYSFKNDKLLINAMIHRSYIHEKRLNKLESNERLEFLGDAVLELVSSDFFYNKYKAKSEGDLTKLRASFVCEDSLCKVANKLSLGDYLLVGRGEEVTGGRQRPSMLSDALEALIGAIYLDGGFTNAKDFILDYVLNDIEYDPAFYDSKSILQEFAQKRYATSPIYELLSETGPDHRKEFEFSVKINNKELSRAIGKSKKEAESKAAFLALKKLGKV